MTMPQKRMAMIPTFKKKLLKQIVKNPSYLKEKYLKAHSNWFG